MRTRYKKYEDYGMTPDEVQETYNFLTNEITRMEEIELINLLYQNIPDCVAGYVALALLDQKGYNTLEKMGLDYEKSDFYGYKRKGLSLAKKIMNRR